MADSNGSEFNTSTPAGQPVATPARKGPGATLRAAREAQGLSHEDVAARTRINARHVAALEQGDYDALPGRTYVLGFARSYAKALGLAEQPIADGVRAELGVRTPAPEPRVVHQFEVGDPAKTPSRLVNWLAGLLVVAVLVFGLVFWRSYYWPTAELPALVGPEQPKPAASAPRPATPAAPAPRPTGPVVFTAQEDRIWVKFYDGNGKQLVQKLLAKGETYTVPADAVAPKLWTGRPDALTITIGGQPVPRIAEKEGIVKDVPVTADALLARANPAAPAAGAPATTPAPAPTGAAGIEADAARRAAAWRAIRRRPAGRSAEAPAAAPPAEAAPAPVAAPAT